MLEMLGVIGMCAPGGTFVNDRRCAAWERRSHRNGWSSRRTLCSHTHIAVAAPAGSERVAFVSLGAFKPIP
ncbi:unnamed protein product, partial [Ixodes persulcatus]